MFKGFKDFLMRGNVIDLAVAVVMGTAFTAVVTSVTKGIINPLLAVFGTSGELGLGFHLVPSKPATFVEVGPIITALLNFAMIAAVLYFVLLLPMKTLTNRFGTTKAAEPTQTELLIEIRDLLAKQATGQESTATAVAEAEASANSDARGAGSIDTGSDASANADSGRADSRAADEIPVRSRS
ncbi:large conductance mechanosensitive channel protein MscL [Nocardia sp. NEAU-351]|uniref:Large-conductance mechanosensitive channel n=1 Tax=Nocardia bovistercoris TaxID=2785916 RepID=A0A931N1F0_9NOCA|nr:large conductance mechanosensitive channel protein MscL [Nocardia bovistercoris]